MILHVFPRIYIFLLFFAENALSHKKVNLVNLKKSKDNNRNLKSITPTKNIHVLSTNISGRSASQKLNILHFLTKYGSGGINGGFSPGRPNPVSRWVADKTSARFLENLENTDIENHDFSKSNKIPRLRSDVADQPIDALLQDLFSHIGITNKFFVEYGFDVNTYEKPGCGSATRFLVMLDHAIEAGSSVGLEESYNKYLKETQNYVIPSYVVPKWHGLLLDAGMKNPRINLHKHILCRENIVPIFEKYNVPKSYDIHFSDMDSHDIFVMEAVLVAGYRPRVVLTESCTDLPPKMLLARVDPSLLASAKERDRQENNERNRNKDPLICPGLQSYEASGAHDCVYSASAGSWKMLMEHFGYKAVAIMGMGDIVWVLESVLLQDAGIDVDDIPEFEKLYEDEYGPDFQGIETHAPLQDVQGFTLNTLSEDVIPKQAIWGGAEKETSNNIVNLTGPTKEVLEEVWNADGRVHSDAQRVAKIEKDIQSGTLTEHTKIHQYKIVERGLLTEYAMSCFETSDEEVRAKLEKEKPRLERTRNRHYGIHPKYGNNNATGNMLMPLVPVFPLLDYGLYFDWFYGTPKDPRTDYTSLNYDQFKRENDYSQSQNNSSKILPFLSTRDLNELTMSAVHILARWPIPCLSDVFEAIWNVQESDFSPFTLPWWDGKSQSLADSFDKSNDDSTSFTFFQELERRPKKKLLLEMAKKDHLEKNLSFHEELHEQKVASIIEHIDFPSLLSFDRTLILDGNFCALDRKFCTIEFLKKRWDTNPRGLSIVPHPRHNRQSGVNEHFNIVDYVRINGTWNHFLDTGPYLGKYTHKLNIYRPNHAPSAVEVVKGFQLDGLRVRDRGEVGSLLGTG